MFISKCYNGSSASSVISTARACYRWRKIEEYKVGNLKLLGTLNGIFLLSRRHNVTATINSISPNPADQGTTVNFSGTGSDSLGHPITAYSWRSNLDGVIGTSASFGKSDLSVGSHNVYLKVQCSNGAWSSEISWSGNPLVINSSTRTMLPLL